MSLAPRRRRIRAALVALFLLALALSTRGMKPTNVARTSEGSADALLRPLLLAFDEREAAALVRSLVPRMRTYGRAWRLISESKQGEEMRFAIEVPVLVFTDDLSLTLRPHPSGTLVEVHSRSRVGRGDFGENARHIRQIMSALKAEVDAGKSSGEPRN